MTKIFSNRTDLLDFLKQTNYELVLEEEFMYFPCLSFVITNKVFMLSKRKICNFISLIDDDIWGK
jgi:hypothetical protein